MSLKVDMKADEPRQPPLTTLTKPNGTAGSTRPRHPLSDCCPAQPDRLAASAAAAQLPCTTICLFPPSCSALTLKQMICKSIGWYVKNPEQNYLCRAHGHKSPKIIRRGRKRKRLLHLDIRTQQIHRGRSGGEQPQLKPADGIRGFLLFA